MHIRGKTHLARWAILAGAVALSINAWPCSVPVFRWALDRWEPDFYQLTIFHEGDLEPSHQELVDAIEAKASDTEHPVNLHITRIDLESQIDDEPAALWKEQKHAVLPWAVLSYPAATFITTPVWAGPLDELNLDALLDSPARQKIVKELVSGVSAVWVLVESGDPSKDVAAVTRLNQQLELAEEALKLPNMAGDPVLDGPDAPDVSDLRVEFSMHRITRDDPAEQFLLAILTKSESDLESLAGEPMTFPVFGRGRALYAFVGKGINSDTIGRACAFLVGGCSCELKAQNPGTDLLLTCDWESELGGMDLIQEIELPPLPGVATVAIEETPEPDDPAETPAAATPSEQVDTAGSHLVHRAILAVAVVAVLVVIATAIILKRAALK